MKVLHRTTRVAMRCTEEERSNLFRMAVDLDITVSTLMRDAITIAYSRASNPQVWRRHLDRAKDNTPEAFLWITS